MDTIYSNNEQQNKIKHNEVLVVDEIIITYKVSITNRKLIS